MSINNDVDISLGIEESFSNEGTDVETKEKVPAPQSNDDTEQKENNVENSDNAKKDEVDAEKKEEGGLDVLELQSNDFENALLGSQDSKKDKDKDKEKDKEGRRKKKEEPKKEVTKKALEPPKIESRNFKTDDSKPAQEKRVWNFNKKSNALTFDVLKDLVQITLQPNEVVSVETRRKSDAARDEGRKRDDEDNLDYEAESESDMADDDKPTQKDPTAFPDSPTDPVPRSKKEENRALLITNLIRPFTVLQLKTMLSHCGKVKSIWINTIKSRCYAVFSCQEEATRARESLHGAVWPSTSPKRLNVDYAEDERMYSETDGELIGDSIDITVIEEQKRKKPKREKEKKEKSEEGNKLDELFKKTVAVPSIYWLPLTEEQAKEREEERSKQKPKYFNPEPEAQTEYQKPRAIPRWRTPERSRRRH